ncbi:undecaprenyldiphospho-muramoylpentapeptide beta-N-acetylglucosaminyltransferase [Alloscardovia theropitheci]|uniref:UDP-N-acetylglucosamine--N-acetylmuramyl-(pentapeptide) pyrophosphoryl-undecaprenol N-acetylglucosamine transferase n=1 Tax=Alloscardovia theropitheci TaxID=2496842 RepID=A0A4R0QS78_9BIFI|nr:undecaprenyldiphospho-muramoylpentapeptide beta-N-acetylglucosaminyltransferase [Alloscardovia theropitheci]TCD53965.1 undecaprenyldiphospho-muramoylpentapeptide beta-N-acetylglucosaminyltransferase [Alloscardovia theropitheci]
MNQSEPLHIVLAGGGTAGHVNPLLSIAQHIRDVEPNAQISIIGTVVGLEARLVPEAGFELDTIEKVPFPRSINAQTFLFPSKFMKQLSSVKEILTKRQADVVVGVGGYASAPAYVQARSMKLPVVIHEQNARAGMANKLGARWADFVGLTYDNCGIEAHGNTRVERVGLPLRSAIAHRADSLEINRREAKREAALELGLNPDKPIIAVTGGSLGALSLNTAVSQAAAELIKTAQIIHLTGKGKSQAVRDTLEQLIDPQEIVELGSFERGSYHISEYWEGMDAVMAAADLVICRSGAGTVAELTALGTPAVYVPLPIGNGEQVYNAQPVAQLGGGIIVDDSRFNAEWINSNIIELINNSQRLEEMSAIAWDYGKRDAAQTMARIVLEKARQARK